MKARTKIPFFGKAEQRAKSAAMEARSHGHHKLADELIGKVRESLKAKRDQGPRVRGSTGYVAAPNGKRWKDEKLIPRFARG